VQPLSAALVKSAKLTSSANSTAIEIVGFQREKALLLVALAVLAASGMEREAHRREGKVTVPPPLFTYDVNQRQTLEK
jgi:hypothetical protein